MESNEVENKTDRAVQEKQERRCKPITRTKKPVEKIKSKIISCRLTPKEYAFIDANKLKLRDMVGAFIEGKKTIRNETKESLELRKEHNRLIRNIANNLNQVARILNEFYNNSEAKNGINNETLNKLMKIIDDAKKEIQKDILHNKTTNDLKKRVLNTFKNDPEFEEILNNDTIDKIINKLEENE